MEDTTMAVKSLKFNFSDPSANILTDNSLVINPFNTRDWADYQVVYDEKSGFHVSTENSKANDLLQSMLYADENGDISVKVNNAIITTSKQVGQTVIGGDTGVYVVSMGNSRLVLLNNLHAAYHAIESAEKPSLTLTKLGHDIDASLTADDLYTEQIRDNTSVDLTFGQRLGLISLYQVNLLDSGSSATEAVKVTANRFGVSDQICYVAKRFASFPEWFKALEASIFIRNAEILDKIHSLYLKASKELDGLTLEKLWLDLEAMAKAAGKPVTQSFLTQWKKQHLQPESKPEPAETAETVESDSNPEDTFDEESVPAFDYKESSDQEIYDHLKPILESLVTDTDETSNEPLAVACPTVLWDNLTDEQYSGKRLQTAGKLLERYAAMLSKSQSILTDAEIQEQKDAAALEKANAEIEEIASEFGTEVVEVA